MLENIPHSVGHALRGVRAGFGKIVSQQPDFIHCPDLINLESEAFADGEALPALYTHDGDRRSPPLMWSGAPADTRGLVLLVEDPDAPTPSPLTHLIAWDLPPTASDVAEGAFHPGVEGLGRNSAFQVSWLAPDPPVGHGPHHYVFQIFALDQALGFDHVPGRHALIEAMRRHVLARGVLTGIYERE